MTILIFQKESYHNRNGMKHSTIIKFIPLTFNDFNLPLQQIFKTYERYLLHRAHHSR